jgi:hypothetical protein
MLVCWSYVAPPHAHSYCNSIPRAYNLLNRQASTPCSSRIQHTTSTVNYCFFVQHYLIYVPFVSMCLQWLRSWHPPSISNEVFLVLIRQSSMGHVNEHINIRIGCSGRSIVLYQSRLDSLIDMPNTILLICLFKYLIKHLYFNIMLETR